MELFETDIIGEIQDRHFGKYRGTVVDNVDPEGRGRIQAQVPSILGQALTGWALPCLPVAGFDRGMFCLPSIGANVWVEFEGGDINAPIWTGGFWPLADDVPEQVQAEPKNHTVLKTPSGHLLHFDDDENAPTLTVEHNQGAKMFMDEEGSLELTDKNGATVTLNSADNELTLKDTHGNALTLNSKGSLLKDTHGNQVEMAASGITVKGSKVVISGQQVMLGGEGGEPVLKGQSFLNFFMTHVHPVPSLGSSLPPVPQGEVSALSMKVKTQ